jgi:hypothetical protein
MPVSRSARGGLAVLAIVASAIASMFAMAAPAHAGTLGINASIKGAGTITTSAGGSYTCARTNNRDDRVTVACQRETIEGLVVSVTLVATPASSPPGQWEFAGWTGCDTVVGESCVISSGLWSLDEKYPTAKFDDTAAPVVSSDGEAFGDRSATLYFHANEPANWFCRLNSGTLEACGTNASFPAGKAYAGLAEGPHTVSIQARDPSGNESSTLQRSFTIVDTALTDGPAPLEATRTATFDYSTGAGTAFECSLDFGAFTACGTGTTGSRTVTVTTDGVHNFRVRARTGGWIDAVAAARSWTVDTAAPNTTLDPLAGPGEGSVVTSTTASFGFTSTEPADARFECRLDAQPFAECTNPRQLNGLAPGAHTFEVRAIDKAGNADPTPATRSWSVAVPDLDGDGYNAVQDCDDADPAISPGRPETLDNGVDENCDGTIGRTPAATGPAAERQVSGTSPAPALTPAAPALLPAPTTQRAVSTSPARIGALSLRVTSKAGRSGTTFRTLQVRNVPAGSTVRATCRTKRASQKKRCPRAFRKSAASGTVTLKGFTRRRLPVGAVITITVAKPNAIGAAKVLTIRRGKAPRVVSRCLPAGSLRPAAACSG